MSYHIIYPTNLSSRKFKSADVYYVRDHLPTIHMNDHDDGDFMFTEKTLSLTANKLFLSDVYLYFENFEKNIIYTGRLVDIAVEYINVLPNYQLDFDNKSIAFNCPMNNPRQPRVWVSCWLMNNLYGKVNFVYSQPWDLNADLVDYLGSLAESNNLDIRPEILPAKWFQDGYRKPGNYLDGTSNPEVFDKILREFLFSPSVISIVLEPVEDEAACILSEKYVNAVYGATIPLVSGYKVYDTIEKIGFDSFSDIIDTSSQYIKDPILRNLKMLENNRHLLNERSLSLSRDQSIKDRMQANFELLRDPIKLQDNIISKLNPPELIERYKDISNDDKGVFDHFDDFLKRTMQQ